MKNKRVFFFGCSCTHYGWPTWADAVGHTLHARGYEYYNFGMPGSGNDLIFKTMLRAKQEHNITSDDLIMVMWTSWNREDRYTRTTPGDPCIAWELQGSVLNNAIYDDDFLSKHWSLEHDIITSISAITAAHTLFNIDFVSSLPVTENSVGSSDDPLVAELEQLNMPHQMQDFSYNDIIRRYDGHPDMIAVLNFVDQVVTPVTGIVLEQNTRAMLAEFDEFMTNITAPLSGLDFSTGSRLWKSDIFENIMNHHDDQKQQYRMPYSGSSLWDCNNIVDYLKVFGNQAWR